MNGGEISREELLSKPIDVDDPGTRKAVDTVIRENRTAAAHGDEEAKVTEKLAVQVRNDPNAEVNQQ